MPPYQFQLEVISRNLALEVQENGVCHRCMDAERQSDLSRVRRLAFRVAVSDEAAAFTKRVGHSVWIREEVRGQNTRRKGAKASHECV